MGCIEFVRCLRGHIGVVLFPIARSAGPAPVPTLALGMWLDRARPPVRPGVWHPQTPRQRPAALNRIPLHPGRAPCLIAVAGQDPPPRGI